MHDNLAALYKLEVLKLNDQQDDTLKTSSTTSSVSSPTRPKSTASNKRERKSTSNQLNTHLKELLKPIHFHYLQNISVLNLQNINLNQQSLTHLLSYQTGKLQNLNISNNSLTSLPDHPNLWSKMCSLNTFEINHNSLTKLPDTFFEFCYNIKTLSLNNNKFGVKNDELFLNGIEKLRKLQNLKLNDNKITRVEKLLLALTSTDGKLPQKLTKSLTSPSVKGTKIEQVPANLQKARTGIFIKSDQKSKSYIDSLALYNNPIEGFFQARDATIFVEFLTYKRAIRTICTFYKSRRMLKKFRRAVYQAREMSALNKKNNKKGGSAKKKKGKT